MSASRIVWTPIPNSYQADGRLRISVLVSPKLAGASTLDGYPAWLDWHSARPEFKVAFAGGMTAAVTVVSPTPRKDLWQKLFNAATPVVPSVAAFAAADVPPIRSWPSRRARNMARREHAEAMAYSPVWPSTVNSYFPWLPEERGGADSVTDIHLSDDIRAELRRLITAELAESGYFPGGCSLGEFTAAQVDFFLAEQFHSWDKDDNPSQGARTLTSQVRTVRAAEDLDFHGALGSFAQYPALMRALGLVVDLTVDPAAIGLPIPSQAVLSLEVKLPTVESYEHVCPAVAMTLTKTAFRATPAGTTTKDGLLQLGSPAFGVIEVDADAGAGGLSTFSRNLNARRTSSGGIGSASEPAGPSVTDTGSEPAPLPANRSTGLSVAHFGRAKQLKEALSTSSARMANFADLAATPFHAEELTAGMRVDVYDVEAGRWYSLCRRRGRYDCNGLLFVPGEDEGMVTLGHTQQGTDPTIYLHESMFTWNGYSLVVNRPGTADGIGPDSEPAGPIKLKSSFTAVGLPKLRYGRSYRLRTRTVDIAGNSLGFAEPAPTDFSAATPVVRHLRYEPVSSPLVVAASPRLGAEAVDALVINGNYDTPSTEERQRHLVPAEMGQLTAEQHGLFDVPVSSTNPGGIDKRAYQEIIRRDKATLDDLGKVDAGGWGQVRYFDQGVIEVPYLPDVLARGFALRGLPGLEPDKVFLVDAGGNWPVRKGFRIKLINGTGAPAWNSATRVLAVRMPPGKTAEVACSHRIDAADLDLMGVWEWFVSSGLEPSGRSTADLRKLATEGQLWQITPNRTLTLVHAVRQPMAPPRFSKPIAVRKPGETAAKIVDVLTFDPDSTASVDVRADWTQPVDELSEPRPREVRAGAHVKSLPGANFTEVNRLRLGDTQEFHDTKYRRVEYSASASSKFVEYFAQRILTTLRGTTPLVLAAGGVASGTVTLTDPTGERHYTQDRIAVGGSAGDYIVDTAAGSVARTGESTIPNGAQVAVAFVTGSVTRSSSEIQQPVVVDVRSSARPATPDIAYLIPTFGWERSDAPSRIDSTRRGNGLRVYLRRPWYSSGAGEMLGVVLFEGNGTMPANLTQYVTQRGQDPLFASSRTLRTPGHREFPLAVNPKPGYRLAESALVDGLTSTVAVAPHPVVYDESRQMWFCDITMAQDSAYNPFLRLALARFQPMSLAGVEISPVVLANFAQLSPDRTLSTVFDPADPALARVTVAGTGYQAASGTQAAVKVLVQVAAGPQPIGTVGWRTASETELSGSFAGGQWSGEVRLPAHRRSQPMRLVVEERERFVLGGDRLTYVDAIEI